MTLAETLSPTWKDKLGLARRRAPELYESSDMVADVPHAAAIRAALDEMGVSAVFCVQGVPTVALYACERYDPDDVMTLYGALWNQGLASLLLVIADGTLRAFSLARKPMQEPADAFERRCLIETLDQTAQALAHRDLIHGAESGRLWRDYAEKFKPKERVDQVLLDNLVVSHGLLQAAGLGSDAAQALLIQAMFIAYLEDRQIITAAYFGNVSDGRCASFSSLLELRDCTLVNALFDRLRADFNGDLFVAPCSFEPHAPAPTIRAEHLEILDRFRTGREEMVSGQMRLFWGYNFRFIPIELVSAVYDRFLGEREDERRAAGAFYTPMFLADTVVVQAWDLLPERSKASGRILDPACGSGVFLVRSFQRLCEHWRGTHRSRRIPWKTLLSLLERTHGWDINGGAVRVAVFSLYVALLEEVAPRDLQELIKGGRILPELWGRTLVARDFFTADDKPAVFDLIIGNPPWTSRRGADRASVAWCRKRGKPMPGREDAWAFSWKALEHLAQDGLVAFLLPSMGFLHNHAKATIEARSVFFRACRVQRVINFADLRFQLFEHANRPAALLLYGQPRPEDFPYVFDYWAPKADLNLRIRRVLTLSRADCSAISVEAVLANPLIFKQRLWMREPDAKLFAYLARLPTVGDLASDFASVQRARQDPRGRWVVGQGYQPYTGEHTADDDEPADAVRPLESSHVGVLPDLQISSFERIYQSVRDLRPAASSRVRRQGFPAGFYGPRVLVPRGVETAQGRLRAAYCEAPATFEHILQAIIVPPGEEARAKLLAALLNSRVAIWFAFHGTASFGSDRPEVGQADLRRLPFPPPEALADPAAARRAAEGLVAIVDQAKSIDDKAALLRPDTLAEDLRRIDALAYAYFGLSSDEVALIEDTVETILPALQPHEGHSPKLWSGPSAAQRETYATTLSQSLSAWFQPSAVSASLMARSSDYAILRLRLDAAEPYSEDESGDFDAVLDRLGDHIHQPLDGNFQLTPDLRVFVGGSLFLIKPMQLRFWLRWSGLADADEIALDLQNLHDTTGRWSAAG
jgi:hypothetical protein